MAHAKLQLMLVALPRIALVVKPSALMGHAPRVVLASTKSAAATAKLNVPMDNALILLLILAQ